LHGRTARSGRGAGAEAKETVKTNEENEEKDNPHDEDCVLVHEPRGCVNSIEEHEPSLHHPYLWNSETSQVVRKRNRCQI